MHYLAHHNAMLKECYKHYLMTNVFEKGCQVCFFKFFQLKDKETIDECKYQQYIQYNIVCCYMYIIATNNVIRTGFNLVKKGKGRWYEYVYKCTSLTLSLSKHNSIWTIHDTIRRNVRIPGHTKPHANWRFFDMSLQHSQGHLFQPICKC